MTSRLEALFINPSSSLPLRLSGFRNPSISGENLVRNACRRRRCNTCAEALNEPIGRLCSDTAISRITAALSGNILGREISQWRLLDPGHTCLSTRAQRIDSCDVLLLSRAFMCAECLAALAYAPVLSYSVSHRPPRATTAL